MHPLTATVRRMWPGLLVAALALVALAGAAMAQTFASGDEITVSGIHDSQIFRAGRRVTVRAAVNDEVFVAGREVLFDGAAVEQAIAVGLSLIFRDSTARDAMLLAGEIDIGGDVADDLAAAVCPFCTWTGGRLRLRRQADVGGDALLAAGDIEIEGRIGGELWAAAQRIVIAGTVQGDAHLAAPEIILRPGARISGDLVHMSDAAPEIAEGASVGGTVRKVEAPVPPVDTEALGEAAAWFAVMAVIGLFLGLVVLGAACHLILPGRMTAAAAAIDAQPWASLGRGVVIFLLLPAVALLLLATVLGLPLALVALALFFALAAVALMVEAYWIGLKLRRVVRRREHGRGFWARAGWTALGLVAIALLNLVPLVGWLICFLLFSAALGAIAPEAWRALRGAPAASAA